jgi:hypothetical protein
MRVALELLGVRLIRSRRTAIHPPIRLVLENISITHPETDERLANDAYAWRGGGCGRADIGFG